ncbi:MAG TPA: lysylphosphatidylglycerol synthase transmembrane domain-containing protein [Alphaproteobacteria bacterium]|nr:lysylphosphatidylglycerol synthase transmembrane domain-containing protein [Alphaproteobacteria bacterium]
MVATQGSRLKPALMAALKVAGSVLFLWLAVRNLDSREVVQVFAGANPGLLMLAVAALLFQAPLIGLRWTTVSTGLGESLPFVPASLIGLAGCFFNLVLPSGIGGDGMRVLLAGQRGIGLRAAATTVVVDRVSTLLGLVVLIEAGAPFLWPMLPLATQRYLLPLIGLATTGAFALLVGWHRFGRLLPLLGKVRLLADFSAGAERLFLRSGAGLRVLAIATVAQSFNSLAVWVLAQALAVPASFEAIMLVYPVVMLLLVLPISIAGWGVREGAMAYGLGLFGIRPELAVTLSLAFGVANIIAYLPGLLVWLVMRREPALRAAS